MAEPHDLPARALLEAKDRILDAMSDGADLVTTLNSIARLVESLAPPALCSIVGLHADGKHLKPLAAPSLPEAYSAAIDGVEIGPCCGSCGTAAWRKQPVIVTDIGTDPLWAAPRELVLSFGLKACWSMPVVGGDGAVLGTIAMYYREPRAPTEAEWGLLAPCAKLIRLALALDRKQAELLANEARGRLAAEASGVGTFDYDFTTRKSQSSPRFAEILGYPPGMALTPLHFARLVKPEERQGFFENYRRLSDRSAPRAHHTHLTIRRADTGEERTVGLRGKVLFAPDGTARRAIGMMTDMTEQANHERELARAKTAAEQANRAKSRFLANMSHELRTPLNAIIGFSEMMTQGVLGRISPPQYGEYTEIIRKSGEHLLSLINDVLDMAKIEAGKYELRRRHVEVAGLAASTLAFVENQAQRGGVKLLAEVPKGIMLNADERALRQFLTNLLSNAVKFTLDGGTVRLFAEKSANGGLILGVEDTGIGMDERGIATALEPFGQVEHELSSARTGTGLGLPLAKAMIEEHGATFHITSALGAGTRVWAEFAAADVSPWADVSVAFG